MCTVEDFNFDRHSALGEDAAYATTERDHSAWRKLRLPHERSGDGVESNPATVESR